MRLKQRPEDFVVTESWRFDEDPKGEHYVYLMDKQKLSTFEAVDRICEIFRLPRASVSFCGLKDKQGRTTQLLAVHRRQVDLQDPDLRLKPLGRSAVPLSAANTTSNRFAVAVRDLGENDLALLPAALAEVRRLGVVNYFDSQRFGSLKHGQGFVVKELMRGEFETALRNVLARPSLLDRSDDARVKQYWKDHWGEWDRKNPYPGADRYTPVVRWLRDHPDDYRGAILRTEPRWRALQVFAYQSWLWNEGVKAYLRAAIGVQQLTSIRYQAGTLLFPRELDQAQTKLLAELTFPLLAPTTRFADPVIEKAALSVLGREEMTLADLAVPDTKEIHFDPEERPLLVFPGRLAVGDPKRDEMNRGRYRVNVAFTLPPGAYATLVVKRLFHWTLSDQRARAPRESAREREEERAAGGEPGGEREGKRKPAPVAALGAAIRKASRSEGPAAEQGRTAAAPLPAARGAKAAPPTPPAPPAAPEPKGFLAHRRAEKEARAVRRASAKKR